MLATVAKSRIADKHFREDLFYRLNVVPVAVPSLADRRDDVPALADHFFTRYAREQSLQPPEIAPEAMAALQAYDWPGNVRQLRNVVERTVILAPRERIIAEARAFGIGCGEGKDRGAFHQLTCCDGFGRDDAAAFPRNVSIFDLFHDTHPHAARGVIPAGADRA